MQCPEPPPIINTNSDLKELVNTLAAQPIVAADIESNGLHVYSQQVCLIQISFLQDNVIQDYIIDPLEVDDLHPLGTIFADPHIELVFHASEFDIMSLKRDFGFEFINLFDTYIAARTLGWPQVGLSSVLQREFGVKLDKKYQQADWTLRPLSDEQLCYAQLDTHYLIDLRDRMHRALFEQDLIEEAIEYFDVLCNTPAADDSFDPEGFWRIRDARYLDNGTVAVLRELYFWRDQKARLRNVPPYKVMSDSQILVLAKEAPTNERTLQGVNGVPSTVLQRYGRELISRIRKAINDPPPKRPRMRPKPDDAVLMRYDALKQWRKQRAYDRGVESDIIVSKQALWDIAYNDPATYDELAELASVWPYRRQKYADEILAVLAKIEG